MPNLYLHMHIVQLIFLFYSINLSLDMVGQGKEPMNFIDTELICPPFSI